MVERYYIAERAHTVLAVAKRIDAELLLEFDDHYSEVERVQSDLLSEFIVVLECAGGPSGISQNALDDVLYGRSNVVDLHGISVLHGNRAAHNIASSRGSPWGTPIQSAVRRTSSLASVIFVFFVASDRIASPFVLA